jgi:hypothetical protein
MNPESKDDVMAEDDDTLIYDEEDEQAAVHSPSIDERAEASPTPQEDEAPVCDAEDDQEEDEQEEESSSRKWGDDNEQKESHSIDRSRICKFFNARRGCLKGADCDFVHEKFTCAFFMSEGGCSFGDNCSYSHVPGGPLSAVLSPCPTENCPNVCAGRQCLQCHRKMAENSRSYSDNNNYRRRDERDRNSDRRSGYTSSYGNERRKISRDRVEHGRVEEDTQWKTVSRRSDDRDRDRDSKRRREERCAPYPSRPRQRQVYEHIKICSRSGCRNTTLDDKCIRCA